MKYSFCFNLLLKTLNLQVSKFPSRHAGQGLDSPGLKLDDGSLAWMVNGCPLITDNDFQNFNHNIFFHLLYSLHSWKKNRIWIIAMMEQSTHEEDGSWDLRRHRERERQERRSRYPDNNPYIRIQPGPGCCPHWRGAPSEYQIWTKYFPIFLLWMES